MNIQDSQKQFTSNIKSKYIKSLRKNNLYFQSKYKRKPESKKFIEKKIYNKFYKVYTETNNLYNIKVINEIITNQKSHIVAEFKDFLIKDDYSEFFWKFYKLKESKILLDKIFNYYKLTSFVFPNYILLSENKYLYKNIQRKQKLINILEEKEEGNIINCKKAGYDTDDFFDISSKVFNSNILDSILNESNTSQIKRSLFGVSTENSNFTDNDTDNKLNILVNNINKIEEDCENQYLEKKNFQINVANKNNNILKEENDNKHNNLNLINVKQVIDKINIKNVIISRNRHKTVEITKYSNYGKNESKLKNNKNKSKISNSNEIKDINVFRKLLNHQKNRKGDNKKENSPFSNNRENNRNIIFNNIYKTDLYLNINNNIIIKETKNKSNETKNYYQNTYKNVVNKLDLNKIKNLELSKFLINSDRRHYKRLKKNDINNLLLSIGSPEKEYYKRQISDSRREYKYNKNKLEKEKKSYIDIMNNKKINNHKKNKTDIIIDNFNRNKCKTKNEATRSFEIYKNTKQMSVNVETIKNKEKKEKVNQFKNTLNNLMSVIRKKNINRKQYNIRNYKNGYSSMYSSSYINKKEKKRSIESYYDSIKDTKNKSIKEKNKKYKINKEMTTTNKNSITSRSYISVRNKVNNITKNNSKKRNTKIYLNTIEPAKFKKLNKFEPKQKKSIKSKKNEKKYLIDEIINLNNKKNDMSPLTAREINEYDRNRYNKKPKIKYTSFIKNNNNNFSALQNSLNTSNFYYILFGRPKSLPNKKEYIKRIPNKNNNKNLTISKKIDYNRNMLKCYFDKSLKEKIEKLNKTVKYKRNTQNSTYLKTKNNSKLDSSVYRNINTNSNLNIKKKYNIISKHKKRKVKKSKTKEKTKEIKNTKNLKSNKIIDHKIKRFNSNVSNKINNIIKISYSQIEQRSKKYKDIYGNKKRSNNNINMKLIPFSYTDRISQKNNLRALSCINKV